MSERIKYHTLRIVTEGSSWAAYAEHEFMEFLAFGGLIAELLPETHPLSPFAGDYAGFLSPTPLEAGDLDGPKTPVKAVSYTHLRAHET